MQQGLDSGGFVVCTGQVVLGCQCGERLVLLGRAEDWYSEGRTNFECGDCGRNLTLVDRFDEEGEPVLIGGSYETMSVRDLIRSFRAAEGQ
jgi:hypothetical protein